MIRHYLFTFIHVLVTFIDVSLLQIQAQKQPLDHTSIKAKGLLSRDRTATIKAVHQHKASNQKKENISPPESEAVFFSMVTEAHKKNLEDLTF